MIHDFLWDFFLYNLEFLDILDSLILDLNMICIICISINIVVFMGSIPRMLSINCPSSTKRFHIKTPMLK